MSTTINAYSVSLALDASKYIDASKMSRQETSALTRDINAARTPAENLARKTELLEKAYKDGAISLEVYNRLLEHNRTKLLGADGAQSDLLGTMSKVGNVVSGVKAAFDMVSQAVGFVIDKFDAFNRIATSIDDANDAAKKLGLSFNELGSLKFAAERLGGGDAASAIDTALGQMLKKGLVEPGESAVDAFKRVADQVQQAATQTERAQIAADAFGKSGIEILAVLQSGSDEIGELAYQWEKTNALTDEQLAGIEEYNDKWDDVMQTLTGIRNIFVAEFAPALSALSESVLGTSGSFEDIRTFARETVDFVVYTIGVLKDAYEFLDLGNPLKALNAIRKGTTEERANQAFAFDSASKMLDTLNAKRTKLADSALAEELKRINTRKIAELDAIDEVDGKRRGRTERRGDLDEQLKKNNQKTLDDLDRLLAAAERELTNKKAPQMLSLDVGTPEAIKYLADLQNVSKDSKPTEEEILAEAVRQRELMEQQRITDESMRQKLQELIDVAKQNGFRRIRP